MIKIFFTFLFFLVGFTPRVFALDWLTNGDGKNELSISSTQGIASFGSGTTTVAISSGYMRRIQSSLAVGGEADFVTVSFKDYSGSAISMYGLGHYIFNGANYQDSIYALAGIGIGTSFSKYAATSESHNNLGLRLGVGKRAVLTKPLFWKPELYFEKVGDLDGVLVL